VRKEPLLQLRRDTLTLGLAFLLPLLTLLHFRFEILPRLEARVAASPLRLNQGDYLASE